MFNRIVKVAMASRDAVSNAYKVGPVDAKAREDLRVRDAAGIPTYPAQKAAINAAAPKNPDVKTLDDVNRPYPPPVQKPSIELFLKNIFQKLGIS